MNLKNAIISLSACVAIGLAAWTTLLSTGTKSISLTTKASLPDAYMEDVTSIIMDKQGKPSMKISSPLMVHYAENDTTELTTPEIILYRKSVNPWYVTAKHAKAMQGIENVDFWDDVVIHHAADENPATIIKTKTLTVHPNKRTAETKDFIMLIQPDLVVNAVGLFADMNSGDLKLLSQARGEYVPHS